MILQSVRFINIDGTLTAKEKFHKTVQAYENVLELNLFTWTKF